MHMPKGWIDSKVGDVFAVIGGGTPSTKILEYWDGCIPWITSADIQPNHEIVPRKYITKLAVENSTTNIVPQGSLVVVTRVGLGKIGLAATELCFSQDCQALLGEPDLIDSKFALYQLSLLVQDFLSSSRGTTIAGVTKKQLLDTLFCIPPLAEQHRIVAKLEELFSELDKGVETLKTAREQLKIYRQAVLQAAFAGKLTEEWRNGQQGLPTGGMLLKQISLEREKQHKLLGKKAKDIACLSEEELAVLPILPEQWHWGKLAIMAEIIGGITKGRDFKDKKIITLPYLRVANVQDGYLDLREMREIELLEDEKEKYLLRKNDILYTEGGDKDKLGRGTIWNDEVKDCVHQNHIFRARIYGGMLVPKYVAYFSQTKTAKNYFYKSAKQTVNLASINMTVLSNLPMPVPNVFEQQKIVAEIETRLSICDKFEEAIEQSLAQSEALRQSILKRAFAGKLVPQDPSDEPAAKLLARIRAERADKTPEKKTTKGRTKK